MNEEKNELEKGMMTPLGLATAECFDNGRFSGVRIVLDGKTVAELRVIESDYEIRKEYNACVVVFGKGSDGITVIEEL